VAGPAKPENDAMNRMIGLLLLLLIDVACPYILWAAESPKNGTLSFTLENDVFYKRDRHYTSGVRFTWVPGRDASTPSWSIKLARLMRWFPKQGEVHHGYAIGQSMFAPSDITIANPSSRERPYAGWLYGAIGLGLESGETLDIFALTIGMVGPASLAEQSQKLIHRIVDSNRPQGWDTQLRNEPGVIITYQHCWWGLAASTLSGAQLDFTPHIGAALGNVLTYGNAGATMRYGKQLPKDYGPPRIQPGLPGSGDFSPASDFGWYLFVGVEGRVVARNIFLDGNTFHDSRSVDKDPFVGDLQFGVVLDWHDIRLSYTHIMRTREFKTQENSDDFGAFTVSVKF